MYSVTWNGKELWNLQNFWMVFTISKVLSHIWFASKVLHSALLTHLSRNYCRWPSWSKPVPVAAWSKAAHLLRLWVWIPPGAWMAVCCECCVLSGRHLCDELITCPEECYRFWCIIEHDLDTSWMRRPWLTGGGAVLPNKKKSWSKHFRSATSTPLFNRNSGIG